MLAFQQKFSNLAELAAAVEGATAALKALHAHPSECYAQTAKDTFELRIVEEVLSDSSKVYNVFIAHEPA